MVQRWLCSASTRTAQLLREVLVSEGPESMLWWMAEIERSAKLDPPPFVADDWHKLY
jgi:hypothetical protein